MSFVCVLKSGGQYKPKHVQRLQKQLEAPLKCLTDLDLNLRYVETIPLTYGLDGWWSKLELFRNGLLNGPHVYFDLDVDITGDPRRLYTTEFTMCQDFLRPELFNSSVMSWHKPPIKPLQEFHEGIPAKYKRWPKLGDQAYIQDTVKDIRTFESGLVRSYKKECRDGVPKGTVVVAYHGKPKPWNL